MDQSTPKAQTPDQPRGGGLAPPAGPHVTPRMNLPFPGHTMGQCVVVAADGAPPVPLTTEPRLHLRIREAADVLYSF